MNCIITLKINDYFPKLDTIPYETFICLFSYGDFKGKIPLYQMNDNVCIHEIPKINSDIKYTLHILETNKSSLIGMSELLIPLVKLKSINPPYTIIHEQKLKLIIDVNTKRKLFKTLINTSDIFLYLKAEIFVPNIKNIIDVDMGKIEVKRNTGKRFTSNVGNSQLTNKKKRIYKDIKINKEIIKNDFNSSYHKTISYDNKNNNITSRTKLLNDIKNSFKKIDEINLSSKIINKSKLNQKRSPKKRITILELMEQKMQPLILNTNENNTIDKENIIINKSGKKIDISNSKSSKKFVSPKSKKSKKKDINTIGKKSSKNNLTLKNSNKRIPSNNRIKKSSDKYLNKLINQQNDELNSDINRNLYSNNFNLDKATYDKILLNKSKECSYIENDDINSNYGILSTDERTEQVLSEIDKFILEKSSKLRDILEEQIKNNINHKKFPGILYMKEKKNINKALDIQNNKIAIKKSRLGNIYNNSLMISQENIKNNYLSLFDLYYLLSRKLSKTILENFVSINKINLLKEEYNSERKKIDIIKQRQNDITHNLFCNININHNIQQKIFRNLICTKNLESKLYQKIFDFELNDYEIIRQKEIERVNKLNEGRKLNILIKLIKSIIFDVGNISQIYKNDKYKQNYLKQILENNNIKEKEIESGECVNLLGFSIVNKLNFGNGKYENKTIKEVDEDKEEESDFNSPYKKKNGDFENIKQNSNIIYNTIDEKNELNDSNKDDDIINEENDENKKIEMIKDLLNNKFKENKRFQYIDKNEFLFDNKIKIKASLSDNNEIIIEIENNKYDINSFISLYTTNEENSICDSNDDNKNEKKPFVYTKKRMSQNEHKKRRRKKRINDDDSEKENQSNENMQDI